MIAALLPNLFYCLVILSVTINLVIMSYAGNLVGNQWQQYSNDAGQMHYVEATTGASQYAIPSGWEDQAQVNAAGFSFITFLDIDTHCRTTGITLQHTSSGKFFEQVGPSTLGVKKSIG